MLLFELRKEIANLHQELMRYHLVAWTSGNISAKDPDTELVVIKPSGIKYKYLTPEAMVIVDLKGNVVEGDFLPSVDCLSHLYVYRHREDVRGIAHTHSPYATAFAAVGQSIPPALTSIADEFGGAIPCSSYAPVGGEAIGKEILKTMGHSSAMLLKQHGVFTIGHSAEAAVKAAVMVEEAAKTLYFAKQLGEWNLLSEEEIQKAHKQYKIHYGQKRPLPTH